MPPGGGRLLLTLLVGLAMLGPFTINTYLPSFPAMREALAVDDIQLQQTLSLYFAAFAFMSLWHGALSDSLGRRPVVLAGLAVYALSSLGCALAGSIEQIYVFRVLQGAAAGAGIVVGRAVIRDLHAGAVAQRMFATVTMLFALAPAIAPVIGGVLQVALGWRATFGFLFALALALGLLAWRHLPETLPAAQRRAFSLRQLATGYGVVLSNRRFMAWALLYAGLFAGYFIYVLSASVFLTRHLGLRENDFIWLFGPATAGLMLGAYLCRRLAHAWSPRRMLARAFSIMSGATLWNLVICAAAPTYFVWYLSYVFVFTAGLAMAMPTMALLGLDQVPDRRGTGASVQLFVQTGFNAVTAAFLAPWFWATPLRLALGAALVTAMALAGAVTMLRREPA